jgi:hypothetical protein
MFTEELSWLKGRDIELVLGRGIRLDRLEIAELIVKESLSRHSRESENPEAANCVAAGPGPPLPRG